MESNDKKAGIPIPTLKNALRPQLKIKGLQAGQSLIERLKQFKKKDLAFIFAGMGVLFMAPLAEHFLMSPDGGESGAFKEGWGFKPGSGGLGQGGSPFEGGLNGLAPGGAAGGGSDVITPLNVRDPSALVMGPGATQQPPAAAAAPAPAAAPSTGGSSDWKDALSQSAAKAGSAAVKRAALPVPKVPLSNGGLRGLGVAAGGGGGTYTPGAVPTAQFGGSGRGDSTGLARRTGDFRNAATRGSGSANAGGFEALKKQAAAAGSDISRAGSAVNNLEQAAGRSMGGGEAGDGGAGALAANDKASAGNQDKGSKQTGESLEFLRMKAEQDKAIELKWEMIKKKTMFPEEMRQDILKALIMEPIKEVAKFPGAALSSIGKTAATGKSYKCDGGYSWPQEDVDKNDACKAGESAAYPCFVSGTGKKHIRVDGSIVAQKCELVAGAAEVAKPETEKPTATIECEHPDANNNCADGTSADARAGTPAPAAALAAISGLNDACKALNARQGQLAGSAGQEAAAIAKLLGTGAIAAGAGKILTNQDAPDCKPTLVHSGNSVAQDQTEAFGKFQQGLAKLKTASQKLVAINKKVEDEFIPKSKAFQAVFDKPNVHVESGDFSKAQEQGRALVELARSLHSAQKASSSELQAARAALVPVIGEIAETTRAQDALKGETLHFAAGRKLLANGDQNLKKAEQALSAAAPDFTVPTAAGATGAAADTMAYLTNASKAVEDAWKDVTAGAKSLRQSHVYMDGLLTEAGKLIAGEQTAAPEPQPAPAGARPGLATVLDEDPSPVGSRADAQAQVVTQPQPVTPSGAVASALDAFQRTNSWLGPSGGKGATSNIERFAMAVELQVLNQKLPKAYQRAPTLAETQEAARPDAEVQEAEMPAHEAAKAVLDARLAFDAQWNQAKERYAQLVGPQHNEAAIQTHNLARKASIDADSNAKRGETLLNATNEKSRVAAPVERALGPKSAAGPVAQAPPRSNSTAGME